VAGKQRSSDYQGAADAAFRGLGSIFLIFSSSPLRVVRREHATQGQEMD